VRRSAMAISPSLAALNRALSSHGASQSIRILVDYGVIRRLRDESLRLIPVYSPAWTDHNASDPGVTWLEVIAYTVEDLLFRSKQVSQIACSKLPALPKARRTTCRSG